MAGLLSAATSAQPMSTAQSLPNPVAKPVGPGATAPTTSTTAPTPIQPTTPATSGTAGNISVPPLGAGLTPSTPSTNLTSPTTSATGTVGTIGNAAATNVNPLAQLTNGQINPNDSTNAASQLTAITNANSPYIQAATQQGLLTAAGRGLENSSLGAGAAENAAVQAAAPLAEQNASAATQGALQNAQLNTQASEFNVSQQAAAQELQAQLNTNTNQFNASQAQAANAANAAAKNTMAQETEQLTEQMNQQDLSGTQAARLAQIQASSQQLIASNQTAAGLYSNMTTAMGSLLNNQNLSPDRVSASLTALQSMTQNALGVVDQMNGMSLALPTSTFGATSPQGNATASPGPTVPAKP